ncbi:MAG TPA: hypothetical protein CFH81_06680 [Sulfurovum sp. UBA12169]|nr:MAG TPA: hypothetical protein CFH81_06680 [Sulfurovum sp. UBA12169]
MKRLRSAFTLIEVLVSVLIISVSIIFVLKLHSDNHQEAVYISERNKLSLQDSLYLTPFVLRYHKDTKDAYSLLQNDFYIESSKSKEILKKNKRAIFIPESRETLPSEEEEYGYAATFNQILLKDAYSSSYFRFSF